MFSTAPGGGSSTAICDGGIFGHHRVDDSWRSDRKDFNGSLVTDGWKRWFWHNILNASWPSWRPDIEMKPIVTDIYDFPTPIEGGYVAELLREQCNEFVNGALQLVSNRDASSREAAEVVRRALTAAHSLRGLKSDVEFRGAPKTRGCFLR